MAEKTINTSETSKSLTSKLTTMSTKPGEKPLAQNTVSVDDLKKAAKELDKQDPIGSLKLSYAGLSHSYEA